MISGATTMAISTNTSSFMINDIINGGVINGGSTKKYNSLISCSYNARNIPKLDPFSRTKFDRVLKDPPLIQHSENLLSDYCSTLEGEDSYDCWQAYFELKDLEKKSPKEEVERLIMEAGGVKSLIGCVHGITAIHKAKKDRSEIAKATIKTTNEEQKTPTHVPDGIPRSPQELEEEEKGRMPDSPFTRLLRVKGKHPAWYSPAPDHSND